MPIQEPILHTLHEMLIHFDNVDSFEARVAKATDIFRFVADHVQRFGRIYQRSKKRRFALWTSIGTRAWHFLHQDNLNECEELHRECRRAIEEITSEDPEWAAEWARKREGEGEGA